MFQLQPLTQALGLFAFLTRTAALKNGYAELQEMVNGERPIRLNQGWAWEAGPEDFIDYEAADFQPTATVIRRAAATACQSDMPLGLGPTPTADTPAAFLANTVYSTNAQNLGVTNSTFVVITINTQGSIQPTVYDPKPINYLGWMNMPTYTPYTCAMLCTALGGQVSSTNGTSCHSYNIYYLRSPTVAPSLGSGSSCPNPPSMCVLVPFHLATFILKSLIAPTTQCLKHNVHF